MDLNNQYYRSGAWGISISIDLHSCNSSYIRDKEKIKSFVNQLCDLIKVKKFRECIVVHFGDNEKIQGFSMAQLIESSLISGHFVDKTNNAYIDIFSCKYYNPEEISKFCKKFFQAKDCKLNYLFRK